MVDEVKHEVGQVWCNLRGRLFRIVRIDDDGRQAQVADEISGVLSGGGILGLMTPENGWRLVTKPAEFYEIRYEKVSGECDLTTVPVGQKWLTDTLVELRRLQARETELQTRMTEMVEERRKPPAASEPSKAPNGEPPG